MLDFGERRDDSIVLAEATYLLAPGRSHSAGLALSHELFPTFVLLLLKPVEEGGGERSWFRKEGHVKDRFAKPQ